MAMKDKGLVKLVEECGELAQIAAKKMNYMHTDEHPDGKGSMLTRLEQEIADVIAAAQFVAAQFNLNDKRIFDRVEEKRNLFTKWISEKHDYKLPKDEFTDELNQSIRKLVESYNYKFINFYRIGTHGGKVSVKFLDGYIMFSTNVSYELVDRKEIDDKIYNELASQLLDAKMFDHNPKAND